MNRGSSRSRIFRTLPTALLAAILVALAWRAFWFTVSPLEPFGWYKDLGVNYRVTAYATEAIRNLRDAGDALGWAPWDDAPFLYLNGSASYAISVPLNAIFVHDAWRTIKLLEVAQLIISMLGATYLGSLLGASRVWALLCGVTYAASPIVTEAIRTNTDLGWVTATTPILVALAIVWARRYGAWAGLLLGFVAGALTTCVHVQYAIFVGLPVVGIYSIAAWRKGAGLRVIAATIGAASGVFLAGAYFLVPTFLQGFFSASASRNNELASGSFLAYFSEDTRSAVALILKESLLSPSPDFNATKHLLPAVGGGSLLIVAAVWALAVAFRDMSWRRLAAAMAVPVVCAYLSFGPSIPLGSLVWNAVIALPGLDGIRTTDRFLLVPVLAVVIVSTAGFARIVQHRRLAPVLYCVACLPLILFMMFDNAERILDVDGSRGLYEPDITSVNALVSRIGERTVSFAEVNQGSFLDFPAYGVPVATLTGAKDDIGGRYLLRPNAGVGYWRHAGVRTIIGTPPWTYDEPRVDYSAIIGAPAWTYGGPHIDYSAIILSSPVFGIVEHTIHDVVVGSVPRPLSMISAVKMECLSGGPDFVDWASAAPSWDAVAFTVPRKGVCTGGIVEQASPIVERLAAPSTRIILSSELLPGASEIREVDFPFIANRTLVNDPWFRNAVDGTSPLSRAARGIGNGDTIVVDTSGAAEDHLAIRLVNHDALTLKVTGADVTRTLDVQPHYGFAWVDLGKIEKGQSNASVTFLRHGDDLTALDAAALWDAGAPVSKPDAVVIRIAPSSPPPKIRPSLSRSRSDGFIATTMRERKALVLSSQTGHVTYRYSGLPLRALLRVGAFIAQAGDTLRIEVRHNRHVIASATFRHGTEENGNVTGVLPASLSDGDTVVVTMDVMRFDPSDANRLDEVRVLPVQRHATLSIDGKSAVWEPDLRQLADASLAFEEAPIRRGTAVDIAPHKELHTVVEFPTGVRNVQLAVDAAPLGGVDGIDSQLDCGARADTERAQVGHVALTAGLRGGRCSVTLRAGLNPIEISNIRLSGAVSNVSQIRAFLPAGTYEAWALLSGGRQRQLAVRCGGQGTPATLVRVDEGEHACAFPPLPVGSYLVFARPGFFAPFTAPLRVRREASSRWRITTQRRSDLAFDSFSDGNWSLYGGESSLRGERCSYVATCFRNVPPGTYALVHEWDSTLRSGLTVSILFGLLACAVFVVGDRGRKRGSWR